MLVVDSLIVIGLATVSLGTIQESDGAQEHTFWLRNCGTDSVRLVQGYTSCGCTTIQYAKDTPIAPNDSTSITLRFNPRGKGGEFEETGTIVYRPQTTADTETPKVYSEKSTVRLSLVGTCITSEETLMRQFPIRVSDSLRLSTDRFDLGIMHVGETKERSVIILHRGQHDRQERIPITFTVDATTPKGLQHIPYPITTDGQALGYAALPCKELTITLDVLVR